jgi:hypothetical protein
VPPSPGDDKAALEGLHRDLEELQPGLHTIQVLTVDPEKDPCADPAKKDNWRWLLLSSCSEIYNAAVRDFTRYRISDGEADRTLAFDDNEDPKGRYWPWERKRPTHHCIPKRDLKFEPSEFGELAETPSNEPLEARFDQWKEALEHQFPEGGSSLWLTIRHRLRGSDRKSVSALFLVFDGPVEDPNLAKVVYKSREFLFDQVLRFYERQIDKQHENIEGGIRKYLLGDEQGKLLADTTKHQITGMKPLITGRIPLVVEGPRGTGKLGVARSIQKARKKGLEGCGHEICPADSAPGPVVVNCMFLSGGRSEVCAHLVQKGLLRVNGELEDSFCGEVIFDDIHLASPQAQHIIYQLVNRRFDPDAERDRGTPAPWVIVTVAPSLEEAISGGRVISELGLLSAFKVSLPTLHDRLGGASWTARLYEFREIVDYLGKRARDVIPHSPEFSVSDDELKAWMAEAWRDNYWGLRQRVLQHVIGSLAKAETLPLPVNCAPYGTGVK